MARRPILTPVLRMAARDARELMIRPAYLLAAAGPLLLCLLLSAIIVVAALLLSLVQVADLDSRPMGTGRAALIVDETLGAAGEDIAQGILAAEGEGGGDPLGVVGWVDRIKAYVVASREGAAAGEDALGQEVDRPLEWSRILEGELGEIPGDFDAALKVTRLADGSAAYIVLDDAAILYSRVMGQRLEGAVDRLNRTRGAPGSLRVRVEDRRVAEVDPWAAMALLLLWSLGVAYTYHGVAVQSVASLLAGEREQRTLDVLLALPITRAQLVWGKLLALTLAILAPTAVWVVLGALGAWWILSVKASVLALLILGAALVLPLTAVGCAISATAPSVLAAQNRLGFANLAVFVVGLGLLFLIRGVGLGNETLLGALIRGAQGLAWGWVFGILAFSLALCGALVTLASRGLKV